MSGGGGSPATGAFPHPFGGGGGASAGGGFNPQMLPGLLAGIFGGPHTQMQPPGHAQPQSNPNAQYHASPAAGAQIQQLLSGQAQSPFQSTSPGVNPAMMTPGMIMARGMVPTTKEGGAQGLPVGGFFGGGANRSPIGDIAGALALGLPISDESWRSAGYGAGGSSLI